MVHIVASSDFHGTLPEIPECDILLIGGDICPEGSLAQQAAWLNDPFRKWLLSVKACEIVGIAGNHDLIFEGAEHLVPSGLNWHYLKDSTIELSGLKIYGTPWQLPFWGAFNLEEVKLAEKYQNIPKDIDILLSHSPAFGIFDEVPLHDAVNYVHTGSKALLNKALEIKPKLFICGHVHCSTGITKFNDIIFANVALLNDAMEVSHPPVAFDIA